MKVHVIYFDDTPTKILDVSRYVDVIGAFVLLDDVELASAPDDGGPLVEVYTQKPCMISVRP